MERKTTDVKHTCMICGKDFFIRVRKTDSKILSKCFHSYLNKYLFLKWTYEIVDFKDFKTKVVFKNTFWKIVGYTTIQREIIYFLWKLIWGWQKIEYWECKECCK